MGTIKTRRMSVSRLAVVVIVVVVVVFIIDRLDLVVERQVWGQLRQGVSQSVVIKGVNSSLDGTQVYLRSDLRVRMSVT